MTKDEFLATLIDKLHIEKNDDALLLANYFIPPDVGIIKTWKVLEKIIEITGPYRSFKDSDFVKLKDTFENIDEKRKEVFINKVDILTSNNKADHVTSKNFTLFLQATNIQFDKRAFIVLLLRKSQSISIISLFAIKQVMYEILGCGFKPEKEEVVKNKEEESEGFISQKSFFNNIRKIMVTYKVAQAFKAQQSKPNKKINRKIINRKMTLASSKFAIGDIKKSIQKFIRGETLSEPNANAEGYFGQKISGL